MVRRPTSASCRGFSALVTCASAVGLAVVAGCGGSGAQHNYPADSIAVFLTSCEQSAKQSGASSSAAASACDCLIKRIETQFSFEDFATFDAELRLGGTPSDLSPSVRKKLAQDIVACKRH